MGKCINHPDRETNFMCMKHNIYLCDECLKCRDPEIYCKFRSSCPIWFMEKRGGKGIDEAPADEKATDYKVLFKPAPWALPSISVQHLSWFIWWTWRMVRIFYHARRWYVHVASASPLVHHYRAVLNRRYFGRHEQRNGLQRSGRRNMVKMHGKEGLKQVLEEPEGIWAFSKTKCCLEQGKVD